MRFLLISDTHGKLEVINDLASRTQADAVIHAGDFGFYDDDSYERLSDREIRLLVIHSDLPQDEKDRILALPIDGRITASRERGLVGEFQLYIDGAESFRVPVYAVWENLLLPRASSAAMSQDPRQLSMEQCPAMIAVDFPATEGRRWRCSVSCSPSYAVWSLTEPR